MSSTLRERASGTSEAERPPSDPASPVPLRSLRRLARGLQAAALAERES
jgi:hypothetical protein